MLTDSIIRGLNSSHLNSFTINFPTFNNLKNVNQVNQCSWRVTEEHWSHLFLTQKNFNCSLLLNRKSSSQYPSHLQYQLNILDFFILRLTAPNISGKLHFVALLGLLKFHLPLKIYFLYETFIWYSPRLPPLILLINNFLCLILIVLIYVFYCIYLYLIRCMSFWW